MPLLLRAYELWEQLAQDSGREVYRVTGGLFSGPPDCLTVAGSLRAARGVVAAARDARRGRDHAARFPTFTPRAGRRRAVRGEGRVRATGDDGAGAHRPGRRARAPTLRFGEQVLRVDGDRRRRPGDHRPRHLHRGPAGDLSRARGPRSCSPSSASRSPIERQVLYWLDPIGGTASVRGPPDLHPRERRGRADLRLPGHRRTGGRRQGRVLPQGHRLHAGDHRPHRASPQEIDEMRDRVSRAAARARRAVPCTRRPACTPTPPTSTSSSPATRTARTSRWRAASRATASSSSPWSARSSPTSRSTGATSHPIGLFDPRTAGDHMTTIDDSAQPPAPRRPCCATLGGDYYTSAAIFAAEQEQHLREDVVLRGARRRSGRPRPVQEGPGRPRERAGGPRHATARCGRSSTSAATAGPMLCTEAAGEVKRNLQCPYHAWTYALDGKLVAAPNLASLTDAAGAGIDRYQYGLVPGRAERVARLRLGVPGRRAAVVRRRRRRRGHHDASATPTPSTTTASTSLERRPPRGLRRGGQLEAHRRELHGVLPLRHDPPRAHRGAARVRRGPGGAVLRRPRRRVRFGGIDGFTIDGSAGFDTASRRHRGPGPPLLRDHRQADGVRQPGARPRHLPPDVPDGAGPHHRRVRLALHRRTSWRRAATCPARWSCSTGSTSRTSRPASAPSRRCRRGPTATAAYSFLPNTTSRSSTSG